uniref:hypothetical protein n=1 Tax=Nitzschia ovalis TaxID=908985 RepID=UPI001EF9F2EC|nr:hypothetical protein MKT70_pgp099 [Nitzschia ovalis]YP_010282997.1 hypothetical protein MKT70_pgp038 [Nitzschia ovalis]ULD15700.1 hypothetical protein [Nitzschia ovalis]ULD15761.1 hypothetical protein [Nitzschia ovalis]
MGLFLTNEQIKINQERKNRSKRNAFLRKALFLLSKNIDSINYELAIQSPQKVRSVTLQFSRNSKIVLSFVNDSGEWILSQIESFKRRFRSWVTVMVIVVHVFFSQFGDVNSYIMQEFSSQESTTVAIYRGGCTQDGKSTVQEETMSDEEKQAMEALKKSVIDKSLKKKWPKSIGKGVKEMANTLLKLLNEPLSRGIISVVEASVQNPPTRISAGPRIRINPTQRKFFPPGVISQYSGYSYGFGSMSQKQYTGYRASATRTQLMFKKSEEEIRKTSSRRQPPLFKVPIKGYEERTPYASGGQMTGKKIYHKEFEDPTIRKAMGLDNNYLTDENNSLAVLKFIRSVLSCDNLLIRKGTLNYQENVLHIFEPNTRVYMCFEIWNEFNDAFYITGYQRTVENTDKFEDQMRDKNWDGNVGLSREERQVELERQAQARSKKNFRKLFKEYSPTIAPTGKLSNQQINEIPKILSKSLQNQADKLTPEQIEILQRFDTIEKGWQIHLDNQPDNISREDDRRNLWRELDPTEAPSLKQQIDDILGPSLGDVE